MSNISVLAMIFWGIIIVISILLILMKTRKSIFVAWIGFLIPWLYFAYVKTTCVGSHCGHLGMALPSILGYSILASLIGLIIGKILFKK